MPWERWFAIIDSTANRIIINTLKFPHKTGGGLIIFKADYDDLKKIANTLKTLGYAQNDTEALTLAKTFFTNLVWEIKTHEG